MAEQPESDGQNETLKAWDLVGERFSEFGRRIGDHYRKLGAESRASEAEERRALNDALKEAVDEVDHALSAVGDALRDQETKESLKRAARSFREALTTTFSDLGEEIRKRVTGKGQQPPSP